MRSREYLAVEVVVGGTAHVSAMKGILTSDSQLWQPTPVFVS